MNSLLAILLLLPALFLVVVSEPVCDGKTPEMYKILYWKPMSFNGINMTNVSTEECSKGCSDDETCASAFFLAFTCYFIPYESLVMKTGQPGILWTKIIRDAETCSVESVQIGDGVPMPIPGDSRKIMYSMSNGYANVIVA